MIKYTHDISKIPYFIEKYIKPLQQNNNLILGGSLSLMLQNHIEYRPFKDIDLISQIPIDLKTLCINRYKVRSNHNIFIHKDRLGIDIFYNPEAKYIELNGLKLSLINEILHAKENRIWQLN